MAHLMPRNTAIKLIDKYGTNCPFEIAERKGIIIIFESLGDLWDTTRATKGFNLSILMII